MTTKRNFEVLQDRVINKSLAFSREEREEFGLRGLLPYSVGTQALQLTRLMENLRRKESDIERYVLLSALQDRNERLFYRAVIDNIEQLMPVIYTPTVEKPVASFLRFSGNRKVFTSTPKTRGRFARSWITGLKKTSV